MQFRTYAIIAAAAASAAVATSPLQAADEDSGQPLTRLYWGDTHLHTYNSPDAALNGNSSVGPEEAYRFARGDAVRGESGAMAKLARPLDFLVVSDHAEYLGLIPRLRGRDPALMRNAAVRRWSGMLEAGGDEAWQALFEVLDDIETTTPRFDDAELNQSVWRATIEIADRYNDPGTFTAFAGYEWTSMPNGDNLHRVVIFRDGADKTGTILPFSAFDSERPEDLWRFLADYEQRTGGKAIAIPHNANLSNGMMFRDVDFDGEPMDRAYAAARARWEPLVEVTQIKGDGETHPALSPADPYAGFETWDGGNLTATAAKDAGMLRYEYARAALRTGLQLAGRTGVNPYRFGMIGSTDAHTGLATAAEDNFWGKFSVYEPGPFRLDHHPVQTARGKAYDLWSWQISASGYAAVWARQNTREALFAAMQRRETYATTGSRIRVRVFGGWDLRAGDSGSADLAAIGYRRGVPMGGELRQAPAGQAPTFLVHAVKDPDSAYLDRIQIIKGWLLTDGSTREQVFNVVCAASCDAAASAGDNPADSSAGRAELSAWWRDPAFDAGARAFYYARVIERPKPRWSSLDARRYGVELDPAVPLSVQDRAYTSPIWYSP